MHRRSWKRATAVLAGVAISGAGLIGLAPTPAGAATTVEANLAVTGEPAIVLRGDDQPTLGTTLVVNLDEAAEGGDTIDIRVLPSTSDCGVNEGNQAVGFSGAVDNQPNVTLSFVDECDGETTNVLRLTFTGAVADSTDITISGVTYDVRAAAPTGRINLKLGSDPTVPGNAIVAAVERIFGDTRFHTAAAIAPRVDGDACTESVVVVSGRNFPDALAAAYLNLPILLVEQDSIPEATRNAIEDMGVKNVTIVGGPTAVSSNVFNTLFAMEEGDCGGVPGVGTLSVKRLSGGDRYKTALDVANEKAAGTLDSGLNAGECSPVQSAILVSGENFPDALAAGVLSAGGAQGPDGTRCGTGSIPIILTQPTILRPEAVEAIGASGADQVIIVGGPTAVSQDVQEDVDALSGVSVTRIAGDTRWETALDLADILQQPQQGYTSEFLIANGINFPDALVGGPLGAKLRAPILLTQQNILEPGVADEIEDTAGVLRATLLGGPVALSNAVATQVGAAFLARN
jgi:putative cell wall-binding protein